MLEPRYTVCLYELDNGWAVELRQGTITGKLVAATASVGDFAPGQALDAALVAQRMVKTAAESKDKPQTHVHISHSN